MPSSKTPVVVQHATKHFGNLVAVNDVSFTVEPGEILALLGPNGAGKTTTISLMLGLRRPTSGSISIYGNHPQDMQSRRRMGIMLQESGAPPTLKVRELITWFSTFYPHPISIDEVIGYAGLQEKREDLVGKLSGGQRQRLYFALAIVGNPDIIFLDEPTVGMDVEARRVFWDEIRRLGDEGKTILLTTHYLEEADALAQRIIVVNKGKIVAEGTPSEIKSSVGGKHIRFRASDVTLAAAQQWPGVTTGTETRGVIDLFSSQPEDTARMLFQHSQTVSDLEIVGAGLEEAFIEITNA